MMAWLLVLLALALTFLALAYALAPVIVAVAYRQRTDDVVIRLDEVPGRDGDGRERTFQGSGQAAGDGHGEDVPRDLPGDVYGSMRVHLDRLVGLGFVAQGWYRHAGTVPAVQIYTAAAARPGERFTAVISTAVIAVDAERRLQSQYVQIACEREDGSELATTSSAALMPPAALRGRLLVQVPHVRDAAALLDIQRRLVAFVAERDRADVALRPVPAAAEWPAALSRSLRRQIAGMVEAELLRPVGDGITYRPTLMGALVLGWSMLWPVSWVRRYQRDRRTAVLLQALGWPP